MNYFHFRGGQKKLLKLFFWLDCVSEYFFYSLIIRKCSNSLNKKRGTQGKLNEWLIASIKTSTSDTFPDRKKAFVVSLNAARISISIRANYLLIQSINKRKLNFRNFSNRKRFSMVFSAGVVCGCKKYFREWKIDISISRFSSSSAVIDDRDEWRGENCDKFRCAGVNGMSWFFTWCEFWLCR